MRLAVRAVQGGKSLGEAAAAFSVPKTTLRRKTQQVKEFGESNTTIKTPLGRKPVLNDMLEQELVKYCLEMDKRFFGLTRDDCRRLAYQLAEANGLPNPFTDKIAGRDWLARFLRRHPQLTISNPTKAPRQGKTSRQRSTKKRFVIVCISHLKSLSDIIFLPIVVFRGLQLNHHGLFNKPICSTLGGG